MRYVSIDSARLDGVRSVRSRFIANPSCDVRLSGSVGGRASVTNRGEIVGDAPYLPCRPGSCADPISRRELRNGIRFFPFLEEGRL